MFRPSIANRVLIYAIVMAMLAASGVGFLRPIPVSAHASFVHGTPGPEDTVCTPATVSDYFAQHIMVLSGQETYALWVTDSNSNQVDNNDNAVDPADHMHMTVTLPALSPGNYTVNWYTVSDDDGHDDSGSYTFTVGNC